MEIIGFRVNSLAHTATSSIIALLSHPVHWCIRIAVSSYFVSPTASTFSSTVLLRVLLRPRKFIKALLPTDCDSLAEACLSVKAMRALRLLMGCRYNLYQQSQAMSVMTLRGKAKAQKIQNLSDICHTCTSAPVTSVTVVFVKNVVLKTDC